MVKKGSVKYGPMGLFDEESFGNITSSDRWRKALAHAANHSLTKDTWSTYKTALNNLLKCAHETETDMSFPLNDQKVLVFVGWMLDRKLSPTTMSSYLAGIRQAHLSAGVFISSLRSPMVNQILQGAANLAAIQRREGNKPSRLPVTPTIMRLIKSELKTSSLKKRDKLLIWSVCSLAFMGAFRIHELLSKTEGTFDPSFTLLRKDIQLKELGNKNKTRVLTVLIKSEKKDRIGKATIVDVYENGGDLCPVKAFEKWVRSSDFEPAGPAFRKSCGRPFTGRELNKTLRQLLEKHLDYSKGSISSHSFRTGMASLMGEKGYTEEQIMAVGRWSSQAYQTYLKLPRTKRMEMAKHIGGMDF